ncbi:39S ribosomal L46, mitochondrial [Paramuricea clavata]|nr:39S ribosomal L46, mitochondrial [Paramuricea clavata]
MHQKWLYDRALGFIKTRNYSSSCGMISYKNCRDSGTLWSGPSTSSRSLTSAAVATNTPASLNYDVPRIQVAVCLQRLPIITCEKTDLEKLYAELQEQLEFEHSSLSDYEVYKIKMKNLREKLKIDEDNESLKKEVATLDSEYQELQDIEQQHIKDAVLGSPRTDADDTGNKHSPNRQLDIPLFLLMQNKEDATKWQLPQGPVEPEETLRQAAERMISNHVHGELSVQFMSNSPSGVYRRPERDGLPTDTPKIFFYQANVQGAIHRYPDDAWTHSIWASKDELENYLPKNYFQSVLKFLL